jgi:hypothetical protein
VLREQLALGGLSLGDVETILLTHIHLDHAGACGTILREYPGIAVYVHERGAPHLINPEKLLKSATRLYGSEMDRLWGAFEPVPQANVRALAGGETVTAGGHTLQTAYTPGHASHHRPTSAAEPDCLRRRRRGRVAAGARSCRDAAARRRRQGVEASVEKISPGIPRRCSPTSA